MAVFKTEITSDSIPSDNPLHQRLLKPYMEVKNQLYGAVLELGCGEGRGIEQILPNVESYLGLDKIESVIQNLNRKFPGAQFMQSFFPPVNIFDSEIFDCIISFQVIEHIRNDRLFLQEIYRLLKPGGTAIVSTPNIKMSLSRNPWHIREYSAAQLLELSGSIFDKVTARGITGNNRVMEYHEENRRSVRKIMKYDILDLQHRLPAFLLKLPYEILNRMNRNSLSKGNDELVTSISYEDYLVVENPEEALDLFYYMYKK